MSRQSILVVDDEPKILEAIDRELYFWKTQKNVTPTRRCRHRVPWTS